MRTPCRAASGGSSPSASTAARSLRQGCAHEITELEVEVGTGGGRRDGPRRRDQPVEQRVVALRAHRDQQLVARTVPVVVQSFEQVLPGVEITRGQRPEPRVETFEQHVGVAHRSEQLPQPLQLGAQ